MDKCFPSAALFDANLSLLRWEVSQREALLATIDGDRARLETHVRFAATVHSRETAEDFLQRLYVSWEEARIFAFAVFERDALVGGVLAHTISWDDDRCELGYWLTGKAEGKGIASAAVAMLEKELFRMGVHRLEIRCDPRNTRSAAVPKRLGYELEGILRQDCVEKGERVDSMVWAKLRG